MVIVATIVVLGVLIFVHELGHFAAAKMVGVEVQRFSIGLGPKLWGVQYGETEYVLSAIPLGGYVKMGGMEDEIVERIEGGPAPGEDPEKPRVRRVPGPRDFDGKPIWARTFVISAGVIMNMVFALVVYTIVSAAWGVPHPDTNRLGYARTDLLVEGTEALAQVPIGARLTRIGDREVEHWGDVREAFKELPAGPARVEFVEPAGSVDIRIPSDRKDRRWLVAALDPWVEPVVGPVNPGGPADRGGLRPGDVVLAVDDVPVRTWHELVDLIEERPETRSAFLLRRDRQELVRYVTPDRVEETDAITGVTRTEGHVGIWIPSYDVTYEPLTPLESVQAGWAQTVGTTELILGFLRDLFTGAVSPRSLGSIVTIGEASGQAADEGLEIFLSFMALFSVNLAILNLLPIPILDGGHLVFLLIEAVRGRALSIEQRVRWSQVGFIIIMGIMILALSNDFLRLFGL